MKTYILCDPNSVEPQKAQFLQTPAPRWRTLLRRALHSGPGSSTWIVHNDSIAVSLILLHHLLDALSV